MSRGGGRVAFACRTALLGLAVAYVGTYLVVALLRIGYPFELEALEGGIVDHVARVRDGRPVYASPSLDFVPYVYTPLYYYLSAAVSLVTGPGFLAPRLVSLLSSIGCLVVIAATVWRETRRPLPAALAAGLFAATFKIGGAWFDLARVDMLFVLLLLVAYHVARFGSSPRSACAAGVLMGVAFLTKQVALLAAACLVVYFLREGWRRALAYSGAWLGSVGLATLVLDRLHGGWFVYYVFGEPATHPLFVSVVVSFWTTDVLRPLGIACAMPVVAVAAGGHLPHPRATDFYLAMTGGALAVSWVSRMNHGGWANVLIPAFAALSVAFGIAVHSLRERMAERGRSEAALYAVCILQFLGLAYDPRNQVPRDADLRAGRHLMDVISGIHGDVLLPFHGHLATLAGKRTFAHHSAVYDVLRGPRADLRDSLLGEIREALRRKRFAAVVLDADWFPELAEHYVAERRLFDDPRVFWQVTGARTRPEVVYRPKP